MRRNDFFKYILLNGSSQTYSELEPDAFPFVFNGDGKRLKNYRIYGAEGGVGDLVTDTEDEHYGKYVIPVKIEGKNLLKNIAQSTELIAVNSDGTLTLNGTTTVNTFLTLSDPIYDSDLLLSGGKTGFMLRGYKSGSAAIGENSSGSTLIAELDGHAIQLRWAKDKTADNVVISPMLRRNIGLSAVYEPYRTPCTINIYLDSPLGTGEYIDFREQKNDSGDIVLMPALTSVDGTSVLYVGTTVQPAKIYLQGGIEEMPVSLQMQSLQDFQSTMDFDDGEYSLDVMPIRNPNLQLNDVGGGENAE